MLILTKTLDSVCVKNTDVLIAVQGIIVAEKKMIKIKKYCTRGVFFFKKIILFEKYAIYLRRKKL